MKKFFLLIVAMCCIAVTGCTETTAIDGDDLILTPPSTTDPDDKSDEELEPKDYPFYEYDVTLYVTSGLDVSNEEYPTTYNWGPDFFAMTDGSNGALKDWLSGDWYVAEFGLNGIIRARHVGKTDFEMAVWAGEYEPEKRKVADCLYHVTVKSPLDTFIVPVTEFGESMDYVIEHETRELQSQSETELVFNGERPEIESVIYYFNELDALCKIEVIISTSASSLFLSQRRTFLKHHYNDIGDSNYEYPGKFHVNNYYMRHIIYTPID